MTGEGGRQQARFIARARGDRRELGETIFLRLDEDRPGSLQVLMNAGLYVIPNQQEGRTGDTEQYHHDQ